MRGNELVAELIGNACRCGKQKKSGQSFCAECYFKLPKDRRYALYRRLGEGYAEAFQDACELLGLGLE